MGWRFVRSVRLDPEEPPCAAPQAGPAARPRPRPSDGRESESCGRWLSADLQRVTAIRSLLAGTEKTLFAGVNIPVTIEMQQFFFSLLILFLKYVSANDTKTLKSSRDILVLVWSGKKIVPSLMVAGFCVCVSLRRRAPPCGRSRPSVRRLVPVAWTDRPSLMCS